MDLTYALMDPTGNVTVLVETPAPVPAQPALSRALLAAEPEAEQVGFLSPGDSGADIALRMAGGEFCGNAAMSAAAWHAASTGLTSGEVRVRVSGAAEPIPVALEAAAEGGFVCTAPMPRIAPPETVTLSLDGREWRLPLLRVGGITHLILPGDTPRAFAERAAGPWCAALGAEALGLMLLDAPAGRMTPLVFVPGADTLYWERSCASGTAAAGVWLAHRTGAPIDAALTQPGGALRVFAGSAGDVSLSGRVSLRRVGEISVEQL